MAIQESWFETPTILEAISQSSTKKQWQLLEYVDRTHFCNQVHNWPAPMKLAPKHNKLIADVAKTAIQGTWFFVKLAKKRGAWLSMARV